MLTLLTCYQFLDNKHIFYFLNISFLFTIVITQKTNCTMPVTNRSTIWTNSIYDQLLILLEVILLFLKMFLAGLESIIKFFVPPYEKTLAGEIILVRIK